MKKLAMVSAAFAMSVAAMTANAEAPANYAVCAGCHAQGVLDAPKTGDKAAWEARLAGGIDALVASAKKGKNSMPPVLSLCPQCSDDDIKGLIQYMSK